MLNLWELMLRLDPREWDKGAPVGLHRLSSLEEIIVWALEHRDITAEYEGQKDMTMKRVFQEAADAIPSRPTFALFG
uniref:Uncharacterized protein n=1 Tax=Arundo donax TaxID=35708 RepID=A0A0A8Z3X2_ARUDO